jgi:ABC-type bacteriocin/lantibiotic exporter with double-glycine peptidase domain
MLSLKRLPNPEATLIKLLKYSGISIDNEIINHELEKHPYYPSMLAISDVLTEINIGNYAFTTNTEELLELATPFIIFTNINGGDFAVVKKIAGDKFYVSNEKMDNHLFVRSEFDEIFQSVVLMIEDPISMPSVANSRFIWHSIKFPLLVIVVLGIVVSELFFDTTFFSNVS